MAIPDTGSRPLVPVQRSPGALRRALDSDLFYSFRRSPVIVAAFVITLAIFVAAAAAPLWTPYDPYDLASISLMDASLPPAWAPDGDGRFLLGTDNQGRDILSTIVYGTRVSLVVGGLSVVVSAILGVGLGLLAGYLGGLFDAVIMRLADVQLSFPAILIALLIDGVARAAVPHELQDDIAIPVLIAAIALSGWVHYARLVRGSTLVERGKDYVLAARVIGLHPATIMVRHVLPNVLSPVMVVATVNLAVAILTEATLSFLGVGVPPTTPSLGTLVRIGNNFLFSGEWWMAIFPGVALVIMVLAVNLLGDWLRDALNPKLR